jgi:hypothetical protein
METNRISGATRFRTTSPANSYAGNSLRPTKRFALHLWLNNSNPLPRLPRAGAFLKRDARDFGVKLRDVFGTLGANQAKLVVGRLRREGVYWTFGLAGFSFSSFSAA